MARFLIRRIVLGIFVMFAVTTIVFGIFFVGSGPQAVALRLAGKQATPQTIADVRRRLHLDQPLYKQYWHFVSGLVFHGNLGYSFIHGQPVTHVLKEAFPITLSLALGASVIWLVIGVLS